VLAAASLTKVFPEIDPNAKYTFGGSGALATDIEQGAPADVFAAASPKQPKALLAKGLIDKPVEFATNTLVLIVPKSNPAHINSVTDVTKPGIKLVICNATVPCGDYARTAFKNLNITAAAMKNVASQTTDVTQTVAEVALGQADAGFVYITDARAAGAKVAVVRLPAKAKPGAKDFIAVVKSGKNQAAAKVFIQAVLSPAGQAKLQAAGFGKP
jgi:molybdate transport system substrate-binding protein